MTFQHLSSVGSGTYCASIPPSPPPSPLPLLPPLHFMVGRYISKSGFDFPCSRTILYVSLVYALGNIIVSLTSFPPFGAGEIPGPMIGLFLIALGTGGIKPCVSAFGGDQIGAGQTKLIQRFFSVFYFAINAGSLLSMLITPVLRGES